MKTVFKKGDYVLATKWPDGDPCDNYCIGFYDRYEYQRHFVVDALGNQFRGNGFRRCRGISGRKGTLLVRLSKRISDVRGHSLWWWFKLPLGKLQRECEALGI